jgi:hypothetical protein
MCDVFEYSVGQHKTTLWTIIFCLFTMLAFGIGQFVRSIIEIFKNFSFIQVLEAIWDEFFWFLITLGITIAFLILLNCRADGCCCLDGCLCMLVFVVLEMIFYPGLFLFFIWQLVMNIRRMVMPYNTDPTDPGFRPPPWSYDFFRLLILSIEMFLLVIWMPLLIVRMAVYLIRCLPCIDTRRLGDMCKNMAYYGNSAPAPPAHPQVYFVQQGGGGMSQVVIRQPK